MSREPTTDEPLCPRCQDEPKQPGKELCLDCEDSTNTEMASRAKELAKATADKYGPAVQDAKDLGVDV